MHALKKKQTQQQQLKSTELELCIVFFKKNLCFRRRYDFLFPPVDVNFLDKASLHVHGFLSIHILRQHICSTNSRTHTEQYVIM